ncbi:hypothetical protein Q1695_012895 [Nippostrongylus brasiliensis]|nr:hypothetical protein Q1695_012895 [Nippostrongylus brasiliensis]
MAKKSRRRRRRMPVAKSGIESGSLQDLAGVSQQVSAVSENIASVVQLLASVSGPATKCLGDVLERSAAALEELNTISSSVTVETSAICESLKATDAQLAQLENLWPSIDQAVEFVNQKKQQLTELERLCTLVERRIAERNAVRFYFITVPVVTRSGKSSFQDIKTSQNSNVDEEETSISPVDAHQEEEDDSGNDSDAPMEISSKHQPDIKLVDDEPELSIFEQYQKKKKEEEQQRQEKTAQSKKRKRVKKVARGEFLVKAKAAQFKVVTLNEGVKTALEPRINFREELLKVRTADRREKGKYFLFFN